MELAEVLGDVPRVVLIFGNQKQRPWKIVHKMIKFSHFWSRTGNKKQHIIVTKMSKNWNWK